MRSSGKNITLESVGCRLSVCIWGRKPDMEIQLSPYLQIIFQSERIAHEGLRDGCRNAKTHQGNTTGVTIEGVETLCGTLMANQPPLPKKLNARSSVNPIPINQISTSYLAFWASSFASCARSSARRVDSKESILDPNWTIVFVEATLLIRSGAQPL